METSPREKLAGAKMLQAFFLPVAEDSGQARVSSRHVNQPAETFPVRGVFTESVLEGLQT